MNGKPENTPLITVNTDCVPLDVYGTTEEPTKPE